MNYFTRLVIAFILLCLYPATSFSGDFASREILGFSPDGNLFAFEEYGIQDGSGFAYSNIYIINTNNDSWVDGSPYRIRLDEEDASLQDARNQSRQMAGSAIATITEPGLMLATNQPLEVVGDPQRMVARPWKFVPPTSDRVEYRLENIPLAAQDYCEEYGGANGYRLTQIYRETTKATRLLHEDQSIPNSRGCPLDYRFADIISYRPSDSQSVVMAIIILFESVGFEGPDGRFLAVTSHHD